MMGGPGMMGGGAGMGPGMMGGWGFGPANGISGASPFGFGPGMGPGMMGGGPGMMGRGPGMGPGMMGGWGFGPTSSLTDTVPFGFGPGMMGGWGAQQAPSGEPISADTARQAAEQYLAVFNNPDLAIVEIMEFSQNFYVQVEESSTGVMAFELLVDRYGGYVHPEPGPNMMWNTKYGHASRWGDTGQATADMTVTPDQARAAAQSFLDTAFPGAAADSEVETFYGYYTLHVLQDGQIVGMLSVNGATGQVWYHHWHGDFIGLAAE
jgi:hypothetical protein